MCSGWPRLNVRPWPPPAEEREGEDDATTLGLDTSAPEFYDEDADDRDERFIAKLRRGHKSGAAG